MDNNSDKRLGRKQAIKLSSDFFPLDIHKSLLINDKTFMIPKYYVESWNNEVRKNHKKTDNWNLTIKYTTPKPNNNKKTFKGKLRIINAVDRANIETCYRIKWGTDFGKELARDYPKSFVRSLEFQIGDEYYKNKEFTEYDIGGFKEQLQVKITWKNNCPTVYIKELFKVRQESQDFPNIYKKLSDYLINDYLLSSKEELQRRTPISKWKPREKITEELNENNIYILLNRDKKEVYFGETKKSLSVRYPKNQKHHSFDDWTEYAIVQLPPETSEHTRLLIERVLIATNSKLFPNTIYTEKPVLSNDDGLIIKNKKK